MTSCARIIRGNTDKIQLWSYNIKADIEYKLHIIEYAKEYCESKNIPLELCVYNEKEISFEDYILKRDLALAFEKNIIIIDDIRTMADMSKQPVDYTKLNSYRFLFNAYKDRFCIPLGVFYTTMAIENEVMEYYGINASEKPIITYSDYLEIKQEMKNKGARFEFNISEFSDVILYYMSKNNLLFIDKNSENLMDKNKFKEALKSTIIDICNEIIKYGDANIIINQSEEFRTSKNIYDKNSKLNLRYDNSIHGSSFTGGLINPFMYDKVDNFANRTFYIYPFIIGPSPSFYMHNRITNDKIYDLANFIVNESSYLELIQSGRMDLTWFIPTLNTEKIRGILRADKNWKVKTKQNIEEQSITDKILNRDEIKKIINSAYNTIFNNENESREVADYYFYYITDYMLELELFIDNSIVSIFENLFSDQVELEEFDLNNEEVNKMIDYKINEFLNNFYLHNS